MYIVLMAGGSGTRFWPRSRSNNPKQLLKLVGDRSMLQMTYDRVKDLTPAEKILVITNDDLMRAVMRQLPEIPERNIIAEPFGRNTAPCIGLAAAIIQKRNEQDEPMVVLPADHLIRDMKHFHKTIKTAAEYASTNDCLITIGITPTYPETGYGYIQRGGKIASKSGKELYKVKTFAEKPNLDTARRFLKSGDFLWNSGMFIWSTELIMKQFALLQPDMYQGFQAIREAVDTPRFEAVVQDVYAKIKSISVDYAIMEAAESVCVLESDFSWNDVGSWEAVYNISEKDKNGNAVVARDNCLVDAGNNYFYVQDKLVAAVGVENLVVVETEDALLICKKDESQRVKEIVENLKRKKKYQYL